MPRLTIVLAAVSWTLVAALTIYIIYTIAGCDPRPVPDTVRGDCRSACENMERLQVDGWRGSPGEDDEYGTEDDAPCWLVCEATEAAGFPFHATCLHLSASKAEAERCYD